MLDGVETTETLTLIVVLIAGIGLAAEKILSLRRNNPGYGAEEAKETRRGMHERLDRLEDKLERCHDKTITAVNTHATGQTDRVVRAVDSLKEELVRHQPG